MSTVPGPRITPPSIDQRMRRPAIRSARRCRDGPGSATRFGPAPNRQRRWLQPSTSIRSGRDAQPSRADLGDQVGAAPHRGEVGGRRLAADQALRDRPADRAAGRPASAASAGVIGRPSATRCSAALDHAPPSRNCADRGAVGRRSQPCCGDPVVVVVGPGVPVAGVAQQGDDRTGGPGGPHLGDQTERRPQIGARGRTDPAAQRSLSSSRIGADRGRVGHPDHPVDHLPDEGRFDPRPADPLDPRPDPGAGRIGVPPGRRRTPSPPGRARTAWSNGRGSGRTGRWSRWCRRCLRRPRSIPGTGCRSRLSWAKIDSAMLLLPRQSVARSAWVNWSM